jgi:CubicO group peptidase (beta-lactamase class C family)
MTQDPGRFAKLDARLRRYAEADVIPGWDVAVLRDDQLVHRSQGGVRSLETGAPVEPDTLWRIYSMTKPVAALAALLLWEEGAYDLNDPLGDYLPEFAEAKVWAGGRAATPRVVPALEPIRIWHLMTHTAGMTYAVAHDHPVDELYRTADLGWEGMQEMDLAEACARIARQPLLFQPGSGWSYSVGLDVLGRLVEVVSGQPFDRFLEERIFAPLGMTDTAFWAPPEKAGRLAGLHYLEAPGRPLIPLASGARTLQPHKGAYGGGGLVSTMADYLRFARMLGRWGELDGVRIVGRRTLEMATGDHLPNGAGLHDFARPINGAREPPGIGFCLLGSLTRDPAAAKSPVGAGTYGWPGAAGTYFWVDPAEQVICVFMTQVMTQHRSVIRDRLKPLVYQALA